MRQKITIRKRVFSGASAFLLLVCLASAVAGRERAFPYLHPNYVILFQGDSITDGGRWRTGNDFNHIMGQDYGYILAAKLGFQLPDRNLTFINRGIGGDRVVDLAARWQADTLALKPDLLSILVGINDTLMSGDKRESVERYRQTYDQLLAATTSALPNIKIILGEPFMLPVGKHRATYSAEIVDLTKRQAVVRELAHKYRLPLIAYQEAFDRACKQAAPEHWSWDGIHPTYAGHGLMAEEWLREAAAFWPKG